MLYSGFYSILACIVAVFGNSTYVCGMVYLMIALGTLCT